MSWITGARLRVRQWLGRSAADARTDEEFRFHLEMETARLVRERGLDPGEARRCAVLAFGGVERHREAMRDDRRVPLIEELWRDVPYAARALRRSPGFALVAVVTLALGIGASVAMYSVLRGVLLRPLPVRAEEELVVLWTAAPDRGADHLPISTAELSALRERTGVFASVAGVAFQGASEGALRADGRLLGVAGTWVTGDFFPVLGVAPALGRLLRPSDDVPGAAPVMVIGHGFWQRHFGGDPAAVGRMLEWNGTRFTVVGVLPRGFEFPKRAEFWIPVFAAFPEEAAKSASPFVIYDVVGRLRPGASVAQAAQDVAAFLRAADAERPAGLRGSEPVVTPLAELIVGDTRTTLGAAAAAVGLLLLIACINVANLLLIRGAARGQELAIRTALGAGRRRLVRQLLTEGVVLALLGGVLGTLLAVVAVRVLVALAPPELPRRELIEVDARALLVALGITVAAALASGLLPAVLAAAGDLSAWLRGGRGGVAAGRGLRALRHGLVVGQVSLAILVVAAAGLLVRSLVALQGVDMGFRGERLLIVEAMAPPTLPPGRDREVALQEAMLARVAAIPEVVAATVMPKPPFSAQGGWIAQFAGEGQPAGAEATNPPVSLEVVGPGYFRTLEVPIRRGRAFDERDREDAPAVAIVSEAVARHTWPGEDPIGKRLGPPGRPEAWFTVVGVAGETRFRELTTPQPSLYLPARQFAGPVPMTLALRTRGDPEQVIPLLRQALREVDPGLQFVRGGSMSQLLAAPLARPRFSAFLLGTFGAVTLLLAAVGVYGALAATVRQRTREIGIRLALGATVREVRTLVLRQGMRLAVAGCALGIAAALVATRALRSVLFGVSASDPATYVGVAVVVLGCAAVACLLPARRASRVDPVITLRAE